MAFVTRTKDSYIVGYKPKNSELKPEESWNRYHQNGSIQLRTITRPRDDSYDNISPFIYEDPNSSYLKKFRHTYKLEQRFSKQDEFEEMLAIANWLGTRWDHGTDMLPGKPKTFDLCNVIDAGEKGGNFWCEIAAETAIKVASSMGWPSRLISLSRDGYEWEHAVAEYWSNIYGKWFVIDTDFNVLYKKDGIPLSAFELCHEGISIRNNGKLNIVQFAPPKKRLPFKDLIPYYKYIHVDMRNDWTERRLRKGSPAGGDLSTWWTARPSMTPILTIKQRVNQAKQFNWIVNDTTIHAISLEKNEDGSELILGLSGYSPYFQNWLVSVDDAQWKIVRKPIVPIQIRPGRHTISARMMLSQKNTGPISSVTFILN